MAELSLGLKDILLDEAVNVIWTKQTNTNLRNVLTQSRNLRLLLEINHSGSVKELSLQITDDEDASLLFVSVISENDYHNLRSSQGLLVDFASFPRHFCELVKSCLSEQNKESPKFILVLRVNNDADIATADGKVHLEIVEINIFKHLCHLSLALTAASLPTKLSYLATYVKNLKANLVMERQNGSHERTLLRHEIGALKETLEKKNMEGGKAKEDYNLKLLNEKQLHIQYISEEREKALKSDLDRKSSREKRDMEGRYKDQIEEYSKKNVSLIEKNKELMRIKEDLEKSGRDYKRKFMLNEDELKKQREELSHLRELKVASEHTFQSHLNTIHKLERENQNLSVDLQARVMALQKTSQELAEGKQEMSAMKVTLDSAVDKLKKREMSIAQLFADLQKSLDVIRKYQEKEKESRLIIDDYADTYEKLEKSYAEKEEDIKKLLIQNADYIAKLASNEGNIRNLTEKLDRANENIADQEAALKKNEHVISWLNKQLNNIEVTETIMKKAPLSDAYMGHQKTHPLGQQNMQMSSMNLATSTPMTGAPNKSPDNQKMRLVSEVAAIPMIPKAVSESRTDVDNKENAEGLPTKYIEPAKKTNSLPVRGLLRKNAIQKTASLDPVGSEKPSGRGTSSTGGRGQKKVTTRTKPSSYFVT